MASFKVIIIGAGVAGLTAAITLARNTYVDVKIFERSNSLEPPGNGLQIPCNACHGLRHLGLLDRLLEKAKVPTRALIVMDHKEGRLLRSVDVSRSEERHGAPRMAVHRATFIELLVQEARKCGVSFELGRNIESIDFERPSLYTQDGEEHRANVIAGCDGMHSSIRSLMHPSIRLEHSNLYAYRAVVPFTALESSSFTTSAAWGISWFWTSPKGHAIVYALPDREVINAVLVVSDRDFNASVGEDLRPHLLNWLKDWDSAVKEIFSAGVAFGRRPLMTLPSLPFWRKGAVTLAGDAAHPMLPNLGQGAGLAVEDGIVLGTLLDETVRDQLSRAENIEKEDTIKALDAYEALQRERTAAVCTRASEHEDCSHAEGLPGCAWVDTDFATWLQARDPSRVAKAKALDLLGGSQAHMRG